MDTAAAPSYRLFDVRVAGGALRTAVWGERGPWVLCAHGVTANHTEFRALADQLGGEMRLIAPDLRGRGGSTRIEGPWGITAHAEDLIAVLDHLSLARADVLLGHSMGGFVAAVAAAQHPQRFGAVLMVDGGLPLARFGFLRHLPFSKGLVERLVRRILGPSLARLDMSFESRAAYTAFWQQHPAFAGEDWSRYVEIYIDYDLAGEAPMLRPSTRKDALWRDVRTQLIDDVVPRSLAAITCPVRFLRAERGLLNDRPLYAERRLGSASAAIRHFSSRTVSGVNHFTILLSARGAREVAGELRRLVVPGGSS
jgi:pimeloyl-ACP methyl ester carboxylesterase